MGEYEIAYTFGVVAAAAVPDRDARRARTRRSASPGTRGRPAAGGQRWFHLYPTSTSPTTTCCTGPGRARTGTTAARAATRRTCAKGYRARRRTATRRRGPTSTSRARPATARARRTSRGRTETERRTPRGRDSSSRSANPSPRRGCSTARAASRIGAAPRMSHTEVETCAPCHARRGELSDERRPPGRPLLDDYRPALLDEGLYFADGQMRGRGLRVRLVPAEPRCTHAGVTCSDCHDPHSLKLRADGNALCARCHLAARVRHARASLPSRRLAGRALRRVPHAARARTWWSTSGATTASACRVPTSPSRSARPNACTACHADQQRRVGRRT